MNEMMSENQVVGQTTLLRLGFLGVGWIGRHRMKAILDTGLARAVAISDPSPEMAEEARKLAPDAAMVDGLEELLRHDLDGIVIATPSALHAQQSVEALSAGVAVFCQKPLGRSGGEVAAVIEAAKTTDRLLDVDLSYRQTTGLGQIRELVRAGALGHVFAADLTFHNAYGPDKPWFYDRALSGGGCVMDLGVHLIDMALWCLDFPAVRHITSQLMAGGKPLDALADSVEDYAVATITLETGIVVRITCSWRLQAGQDAVIDARFFGTEGGASMHNVGGSFYDFMTERFRGTSREILAEPPEDWGGRAAAAWASRLAQSGAYDPACESILKVTETLDGIYKAAST
ncbi:Gfo/Idh/MocA family oxidoreductase [Neorhizobium lilium]|uniref:Gfo/Idh/MocA family oxidoreductase n=1 Tax=Neorhizobium lilium TaxID=2503024 RepID=A0A444LBE4_9HYPH|nr:Gfo/Idh/MocA family oxidoreductase [Neorhizobium lilium]RWX74984.1 Gfo/Idh/MocA family oxidoreductase [Neorhizobium lilium]